MKSLTELGTTFENRRRPADFWKYFDAETLDHGHHQGIAFLRADHGEPDAGIAAGRLDDGLAGFEIAGFLGRLDHAERQPVFHRSERIERLDLDEQVHIRRRQFVDPDDGRVAHGSENVVEFASHFFHPCFDRGFQSRRFLVRFPNTFPVRLSDPIVALMMPPWSR